MPSPWPPAMVVPCCFHVWLIVKFGMNNCCSKEEKEDEIDLNKWEKKNFCFFVKKSKFDKNVLIWKDKFYKKKELIWFEDKRKCFDFERKRIKMVWKWIVE